MPTLHQFGITTLTHDKLAGIKRRRSNDTLETPNCHADVSSPTNDSSGRDNFVPTKTPSALLSRDPHQLCRLLNVSLDSLKTIRAGVADALIADESTGHSGCAEIIGWLGRGIDFPCQEDAINRKHCIDDANSSDNDRGNSSFRRTHGSPQLIVGSISAIELAALSLHIGNGHPQHVSTGSDVLDQLLCVEIDLTSKLSYPFHVNPSQFCHINNNKNTCKNSGRTNGGVPFGYVTEVSGPTSSGKTQLCLSVISNALLMQVKVIYVTFGNVQSISRRLFTLCVEKGRARDERDVKQFAERQMERISIVSVSDGYELLALLAKIENQELHDNNAEAQSVLMVIDSISAIIGHHLSSLTSGAALINQVRLTLRRMTRTIDGRVAPGSSTDKSMRRFGTMITNGSVTNRSENIEKNSMGRYWHVSDIALWMEEETQNDELDIYDSYQSGAIGLYPEHRKILRTTLLSHWGKKRSGSVRLVVGSGGISDL